MPDAFDILLDTMLLPLVIADHGDMVRNRLEDLSEFERTALSEIMLEIGERSEGYTDALGDIFMDFVSHGHNGQFFTPQPITDMMAQMIITDPADGKSICDPTCGSGRMLLSAAKINRKFKFTGADLDQRCCKMTAINLAMNSLQGEVAWMNTLTMEHYGSLFVHIEPITRLPFIITRGKGQTHVVEQLRKTPPQPPQAIQEPVRKPGMVRQEQLVLF